VFDYAIWVDRSDYLPQEDRSSMSLEIWMADYVIDNNGGLEDLRRNTRELMTTLLQIHS
jgi:dephospho-CoA kinase